MLLRLVDTSAEMVAAWQASFRDIQDVEVLHGNILDFEAVAIVSPANSFGFMDGGIDLAYSSHFGWDLQRKLQLCIRERFAGELPVGQAALIPTDNPRIPWLISAPTMRVPSDIRGSMNAYLAFRAALLIALASSQVSAVAIPSLLCPGLGTGVGQLNPVVCARQMRLAHMQVCQGPAWFPSSLSQAKDMHLDLVSQPRST